MAAYRLSQIYIVNNIDCVFNIAWLGILLTKSDDCKLLCCIVFIIITLYVVAYLTLFYSQKPALVSNWISDFDIFVLINNRKFRNNVCC